MATALKIQDILVCLSFFANVVNKMRCNKDGLVGEFEEATRPPREWEVVGESSSPVHATAHPPREWEVAGMARTPAPEAEHPTRVRGILADGAEAPRTEQLSGGAMQDIVVNVATSSTGTRWPSGHVGTVTSLWSQRKH